MQTHSINKNYSSFFTVDLESSEVSSINNSLLTNDLSVQQKSLRAKVTETFKIALKTGFFSALDIKLTPMVKDIVSNKLGFCLGHVVPKTARTFLTSLVNPLSRLHVRLGSLFGKNISGNIFVPALCEEIEFRWLVQDVLLRKVPHKIIESLAPDYAYLNDAHLTRISRIALSALIFAICHVDKLECSEGGGIDPLIGGLLYGSIYEYTDWSLVGCINLHCIYNLLMNQ